jgi:predicted HTH domain antitoxin
LGTYLGGAANKFGVFKRLVAAGSTIKRQGHPDLISLFKNGIMSIERAALVSALSMDSQEEILNNSPEDFRKAIKDVQDKNKLGKSTGRGK